MTATEVKAITGGTKERITREVKLEKKCLTWRRELRCCTQFSCSYKDLFCFMPLSLMASAQSGIARRIDRRGESRFGGGLEGLEHWQEQGDFMVVLWGLLEVLRRGEWWNFDSIFADSD